MSRLRAISHGFEAFYEARHVAGWPGAAAEAPGGEWPGEERRGETPGGATKST